MQEPIFFFNIVWFLIVSRFYFWFYLNLKLLPFYVRFNLCGYLTKKTTSNNMQQRSICVFSSICLFDFVFMKKRFDEDFIWDFLLVISFLFYF